MSAFEDAIADKVLSKFDSLPSKRKPSYDANGTPNWIPLSGFVIADDKNNLECIALATGMKCLPTSKVSSAKGHILHDWHAEILALRSLNHFLLHECYLLASAASPPYTSPYIRRRHPEEQKLSKTLQPFTIHSTVRIFMYSSEAPCGDASMELIMAAQEDATPWDPPIISSPNPPSSTSTLSPTSATATAPQPSAFSPAPQTDEIDPLASATAGLSISLDTAATEPVLDPNDPSNFLIRATQGHSIKIASESLLTPVLEDGIGSICPRYVVHGTTAPAWKKILSTGGLSRMGRTHVHFASGLTPTTPQSSVPSTTPSTAPSDPTTTTNGDSPDPQNPPISGFRASSTVLIWVDVQKSLQAAKKDEKGLLWWRSTNGVILTEGDERGIVGLEWVDRVEERRPNDPGAERKVIWRLLVESFM